MVVTSGGACAGLAQKSSWVGTSISLPSTLVILAVRCVIARALVANRFGHASVSIPAADRPCAVRPSNEVSLSTVGSDVAVV